MLGVERTQGEEWEYAMHRSSLRAVWYGMVTSGQVIGPTDTPVFFPQVI